MTAVAEILAGRPVRPDGDRIACACGRAGHRYCKRVARPHVVACVNCAAEVPVGPVGGVPERCDECKRRRRTEKDTAGAARRRAEDPQRARDARNSHRIGQLTKDPERERARNRAAQARFRAKMNVLAEAVETPPVEVEEEAPPTDREPRPWGAIEGAIAEVEAEIRSWPRERTLWQIAKAERDPPPKVVTRTWEPVDVPRRRPLANPAPKARRPPLFSADGPLIWPEVLTWEAFRAKLREQWPTDTSPRPTPTISPIAPATTPIPVARRAERVAERSKGDRVVDLLRERPRRPIAEITTAIYGEDDRKGRSKTSFLLNQLQGAGRVRNVGRGAWEAT